MGLSSSPVSLHYLCLKQRRAGSCFGSSFLARPHLLCYFFFCSPRMSRVPAAENLASRMLTAFPPDRISAQDALLHGFFSPLPPQLYQVPAGKLTLNFISPRKSCCTCYLLWVSSLFWKSLPFTQISLFSACTPSLLLYAAKFTSHCKFENLLFCFLPLDHCVNTRRGLCWAATMVHLQSRGVYALTGHFSPIL